MAEITVKLSLEGAEAFKASLGVMRDRLYAATRSAVVQAGSELERDAKMLAPVRTGTLRRGIISNPAVPYGSGWEVKVGPTVIYSRRVELGFLGYDRIGRFYGPPRNPSMHPYFMPAYTGVTARFEAIMAAHWARVIET